MDTHWFYEMFISGAPVLSSAGSRAVCVLVEKLRAPASICKSGQYVQRRELHVRPLPAEQRMPNWEAGGRWCGV